MLIAAVPEFTRPTNSSIIFGGSPAAGMTVDVEMIRAIPHNYMQNQRGAISRPISQKKPASREKYDKLSTGPESHHLKHA